MGLGFTFAIIGCGIAFARAPENASDEEAQKRVGRCAAALVAGLVFDLLAGAACVGVGIALIQGKIPDAIDLGGLGYGLAAHGGVAVCLALVVGGVALALLVKMGKRAQREEQASRRASHPAPSRPAPSQEERPSAIGSPPANGYVPGQTF